MVAATPVEIFCSYAHKDEELQKALRAHLSSLEHQGRVFLWHDRLLAPGMDWATEIDAHLNSASLILLLLSADFLASKYCYGIEMKRALERQEAGEARIIPIILRAVHWQNEPIARFQALPRNALPVTSWDNPDEAFTNIADEIEAALNHDTFIAAYLDRNRVWTVPHPRNPLFTGREEELQAIEDALKSGQNAAIEAISGLGGVGKTQLALEYAYRHRAEYRYIFWALADTRETLSAAYLTLAELLNLPGKSQPEQRYIIEAVKSWLEKTPDWLLILDNADDLEVLHDFLPTIAGGRILLTTRVRAYGGLAKGIELRKLPTDKAVSFLLRRSGTLADNADPAAIAPAELTAAQEIERELDGLPLALDQAAAYIEETSCGLQGYLRLYRKERKELLKARGGKSQDHPDSVATTWKLAFEKIEKANPAAADLLRLCAFLAPDDIPELLITEGEVELTGPLKKLARSPLKLNAAIAELQKYSLISRDPTAQTLSLHRLVQIVIRDSLLKNTARAWAVRVVRTMNRVFPWAEDVTKWEICRQLLPHAQECAALIGEWQMDTWECGYLLNSVGIYLKERAEYSAAQLYCEKALVISEKINGKNHINTLSSLNNLANIYYDQGKYEEAVRLHEQVLAIRHRVLGEEHPDTATSLNNLANAYNDQGKYEGAVRLYEQALAIERKVLGEEHPDTAGSLDNLATVYHDQGKYEEAVRLNEQALAIRRKVLGEEHPDTAMSLNNLGLTYQYQERYAEAESSYQKALAIRRKVLGEEHRYTATTLNNFGEIYYAQGKYREAEDFYQQALIVDRKVLGETHPDVAHIMNNLGKLSYDQGKCQDALPFFDQALAIRLEKLGAEHPDTKKTRENYEETLRKLEEEKQNE